MTSIRDAVVDDADALGELHVQAWRDAYREMMPDAYLDALDPKRRAATWRQRLGADGANRTVVVERNGGRLVGFATAGPSEEVPGFGEVYAIYVLAPHWGEGIGRALMVESERWLQERGYRDACLWVLGVNGRARRFYEIAGWSPDGTTKDEDWGGRVLEEVRYRKTLQFAESE